jgi:hypothetical protein
MSNDYNQDLEIDFSRLDENWRDHSANYMQWSEKWVNAVAERDRAKENLDVVKAELDREVRDSTLGKKPTETAITAMITMHSKHRAAVEQLNTANEKVNLLASAKSAFDHRKKALEGLTQLWVNGYWSEPKVAGELKEQVYNQKQTEQLNLNPRLLKRKTK